MECPKCKSTNPQGAAYCQLCYEVLNRSAAQRYSHKLQRERRRRQEEDPAPEDRPVSIQKLAYPTPMIRVDSWMQTLRKAYEYHIRPNSEGFRLAAAGVVLLLGVLYYASPVQRMTIYGSRLEYRVSPKVPLTYLVGLHAELKGRSERQGQLDTPLPSIKMDEMGTVNLKASPARGNNQNVDILPREWVRITAASDGNSNQSISLSDPSLKPARVLLGRHGNLLKRVSNISPRLGRAVPFLMPRWPAGLHRKGDRWVEPVAWLETIGEWKFFWKGELYWTVAGFESHYGTPCTHLAFKADVTPHVWSMPAWAKSHIRSVAFTGAGQGDALFDARGQRLLSNTFFQTGSLNLPISDLSRIPPEERIGRSPGRRLRQTWGPIPGALVFQIQSKLDIRQPS